MPDSGHAKIQILIDGVEVGGSPLWVIPKDQADIIKLVAACRRVVENYRVAAAEVGQCWDTFESLGGMQPIIDAMAAYEGVSGFVPDAELQPCRVCGKPSAGMTRDLIETTPGPFEILAGAKPTLGREFSPGAPHFYCEEHRPSRIVPRGT